MSLNPPEYYIARWCFLLATLILLGRLGWWLAFERSGDKTQTFFLAVLIFGFIGGLWIFSMGWITAREHRTLTSEALFTKNFPGISFQTLIKLNNISVSENHRKYIFDLGRINGSRLSLYITPDGIFTFSFLDAKEELHSIRAPIGNGGVPFGKFFYLVCELGIDGQSTLLRMIINGIEFESKRLQFKIDLGGIDTPSGVVGADLNGENGSSFDMVRLIILSETLTTPQIVELKKSMDDYQSAKPNFAFIEYNGKQWMRFNKTGFRDLSQDNKLFQPIWKENK